MSETPPRGVTAIKRRYVDLLESVLKEAAPDQSHVDRSAATYILFGMMNWIYNWYDPKGKLKVDDLAQNLTHLFLEGFAPGNVSETSSSDSIRRQPEDLSIWRGVGRS